MRRRVIANRPRLVAERPFGIARRFVDAAFAATDGAAPVVRLRGIVSTPLTIVMQVIGAGVLGVGLVTYTINGVPAGQLLLQPLVGLPAPLDGVLLDCSAGLYLATYSYTLSVGT